MTLTPKGNTPAKTPTVLGQTELEAQRAYVRRKLAEHCDFNLMVADAFIRGMRDLGYRSTATALDELIDNPNQAGASHVGVMFRYGAKSDAKPDAIAVVDDGHGMEPDMIRFSVLWGGTHREDDRQGFGRYGYGLPSACVSQGRRFTVYSATENGNFFAVTVDVDDIGAEYAKNGRVEVAEATPATLPEWLQEEMAEQFTELNHGTIVLIDRLEPSRLTWKTTTHLERNLLEHFGLTYRNYLRDMKITVNGTPVEPVDPLFLTPGCRYYDLDEERAIGLEPANFDVKDADTEAPLGKVKVRFAYMPPGFLGKVGKRGTTNARFHVRNANNGIIVLRNGRQIDVITRFPSAMKSDTFGAVRNDDKYWGIEVDFPATLDEEFHVTTSKQQVSLSDRIWDLLRQNRVFATTSELRQRYTIEVAALKNRVEADEKAKRASEQAMEDAAKFKTKKPGGNADVRRRKAQDAFDREVHKRAEQSGVPAELIERELAAEAEGHPYKVETGPLPGAPFFYPEQRGGQLVLHLNTSHRFFTEVYAAASADHYVRSAIEVMLFVVGECESDAGEDRQLFYTTERSEWSTRLHVALDRLRDNENVADARDGADEPIVGEPDSREPALASA